MVLRAEFVRAKKVLYLGRFLVVVAQRRGRRRIPIAMKPTVGRRLSRSQRQRVVLLRELAAPFGPVVVEPRLVVSTLAQPLQLLRGRVAVGRVDAVLDVRAFEDWNSALPLGNGSSRASRQNK